MSFQIETVSASQKRIDFVVPQTDVAGKVEEAFRKVAVRAQLPGFRRGKVPRRLLEDRFGKQIRQDVASELIDFNFRIASQEVSYLGQPRMQSAPDLKESSDFAFSVLLDVKPELQATGYQSIEIDFPVPPVTDAQVDAAVQAKTKDQARLQDAEEGKLVEEGDLVLTEIWEQTGEDTWNQTDFGTMINTKGDKYHAGIEPLLIGAARGEERTGEVNGKTLRVKVNGIQISRVPDLDDALAGKLGYEGGVEAMKAALRMELEARANDVARNQARVQILQKIVAANPTTVPDAMVESHFTLLQEEMKIQNTWRGKDARQLRLSDAQRADLRRRAAFAAQASLVLEAVARQEGVEITDADLDAKYQEIADLRGQRVEAIRGYFVKENAVEELRKRLLEERTLEWILEQADLKVADAPVDAPADAPADAPEAAPEAAESAEG